MKAIVTIPPYAAYLKKVAEHPIVEGFRLNTVMPVVKESLEELLKRLQGVAGEKPVWVDLKGRQMRISRGTYYDSPKIPTMIEVEGKKIVLDPSNPKAYGELRTPPWSIVEIDHEIELDTTHPVKCYFNDGLQTAHIVRVEGNKLVMLDGPQRVVGGGESINILHPSLKIKGNLTLGDEHYIEAGKVSGVHHYMLSYVEQSSDIADVLNLDPNAKVMAKIESRKGLDWVASDYRDWKKEVPLMAARGDLYVEVGRPHKILRATRAIVEADPRAVVASRIFGSLRTSYTPSCSDISDLGYLAEIGYSRVLIGDDICFHEESLFGALNLLSAISQDYQPIKKSMGSWLTRLGNKSTKTYGGGLK